VSSEAPPRGGPCLAHAEAADSFEAGRRAREEKLRFRDWRFRVRDILAAIQAAIAYCDDLDAETFAADRKTVDAVIRNLVVMGESVRWIPGPIKEAHPSVPWSTMRGVRNIVVHEYFGVDQAILWETVQLDLPPLVGKLEAVLAG
jgi:uncharacterized protein with HEPN domain